MADHGDDVAEMLMSRTFNSYNARSLISYIFSLNKKRAEANTAGVLSEDMGKNTVDYNTEYYDMKKLGGFEAEKLSSFDFAAIKAYAVKELYGIEACQVKDCLLYKSKDFVVVKSNNAMEQIKNYVAELSMDKNKVIDIVTSAKIADQDIETQLFSKLPYRNKSLNVELDKSEQIDSIRENIEKDKNVTIKKVVLNKNNTTKERVTARAKSASAAKSAPKKTRSHSKQVAQHLSK